MHLWGLWCLGLYVYCGKRKYIVAYLICLLFVILSVSRQHIVYYSIVGFLFLFYKIALWKKVLFIGIIFAVITYILPRMEIYRSLVDLTTTQMEVNNGGKDDVRIEAAKFFIFDFPQNIYTYIFGHGAYHSHSNYGEKMYSIMHQGYILSDIGFVKIYIFYGLLGLMCIFYILKYVHRTKIPQEFIGIKLFIYYAFLSNIFSNNLDASMVSISICLYVIYINEIRSKSRVLKTY